MMSSITGRTAPSRNLPCIILCSSMALSRFSSDFSPKPFSPRSLWAFAAFSKSSIETIPSSPWSLIAVLGPTPSSSMSSRTPLGRDSLSSSSCLLPPVSRISSMMPAMLFPTPGISWSSPLSRTLSMLSVRATTLWAAMLKARLRKRSPLMVRISPIS